MRDVISGAKEAAAGGGTGMRRGVAGLGVAIFCALGMSACANNEAPPDNSAFLPPDQRVSNVPWNKPESWEGRGALGSLANNPRLTGGQ